MEVLVLVSLFHGCYKLNRYGHSSGEERGKLIAMTVFGFLFYLLTDMACLKSPACPFQIPILMILHIISALRRLGANATLTFLNQLKLKIETQLRHLITCTGTFAHRSLRFCQCLGYVRQSLHLFGDKCSSHRRGAMSQFRRHSKCY
jgi:hypothetical protein